MNTVVRLTAVSLVCGMCTLPVLLAEDWPGFRGGGDGSADDTQVPVPWTRDNILWKFKLPGPGAASPITHGSKVFVTSYSGYGSQLTKGFSRGGGFSAGAGGRATGDPKQLRLHLHCLNAQDGKQIWQKDIQPKLPEVPFTGFLREHGYASSTPVTDGERVYVFFGKTGVLAFDMDGKQLWQTSVGTDTDKWGSASSPIVCQDLVIVNAAIESGALVALDKKTGREVWRTKGIPTCWTSPLLVETAKGQTEVVLSLPGRIVGYDPATGKELWRCQGIGNTGRGYTISTPIAKDGIIYVVGGGGPGTRAAALAIRTGGRGDVTKTHILWRQDMGTSTSSPVLCGERLCWVSGKITSLNASNGKNPQEEELYKSYGEYVSPVVAGNTIIALTRLDGVYILSCGDELKNLDHFTLPGDSSICNASPAISNGRIYIRSSAYLYCIGKKTE